MRKYQQKFSLSEEMGELVQIFQNADGSVPDDVIEGLLLEILQRRYPRLKMPSGILGILELAAGQAAGEAQDMAAEFAKIANHGRRFSHLSDSIYLLYGPLYNRWQAIKNETDRAWKKGEMTLEEAHRIDQEATEQFRAERLFLRVLVLSAVKKDPSLGDLPPQEFYRHWQVRAVMKALQRQRATVPNRLWLAYGDDDDAMILDRDGGFEVHKVERDATSFGDRVEVLRFDAEGNRLSGGAVLWSVGRYSLAEEGASETIEGEGAAADSVVRSPLPSEGVKRLFERESGADQVAWYPDGSLETLERRGGGAASAEWQRCQWDPASNSFRLLDKGVCDLPPRTERAPQTDGRSLPSRHAQFGAGASPARPVAAAGRWSPGPTILPQRHFVSLAEKANPYSPHFDLETARAVRREGYRQARRAERPPAAAGLEHLGQGRLLMTAAERFPGSGGLRVPVYRRPPPSWAERRAEIAARHGPAIKRAMGTPQETAAGTALVLDYAAAAEEQDLRDREEAWAAATKADPEIGGAKLEESLRQARLALDRYGDKSLYDYLDDSGLGNHPGLIRMAQRIGAWFERQ